MIMFNRESKMKYYEKKITDEGMKYLVKIIAINFCYFKNLA